MKSLLTLAILALSLQAGAEASTAGSSAALTIGSAGASAGSSVSSGGDLEARVEANREAYVVAVEDYDMGQINPTLASEIVKAKINPSDESAIAELVEAIANMAL